MSVESFSSIGRHMTFVNTVILRVFPTERIPHYSKIDEGQIRIIKKSEKSFRQYEDENVKLLLDYSSNCLNYSGNI